MNWFDRAEWAAREAATALNMNHTLAVLWTKTNQLLLNATTLKMGPLVLPLLYVWLRRGSAAAGRGVLAHPAATLRGTAGIAAAIVLGRLLQGVLPMRPRPRFVRPDVFPETGEATGLVDWSSMPSDTAMMVGALVTATWAASRPLGWFSLAWGALFVCFPRVYFGVHYVSDIVVGAALGAALMVVALRVPLPASALDWLPRLDAHRPRLVILGLFILGWQVIESFWTARQLVAGFGKAARIISRGAG